MPRFLLTVVTLFITAALGGCSKPPPPPTTTAPAADRIIVLSPALAIICQDLGLEDSIVGRHDWDLALADSIPKVGDHLSLDYEAIIRQEPTLVIAESGLTEREPRLIALAAERGFAIAEYPMLTLDDIAEAADDLYLDLVADGFAEQEPRSPDDAVKFVDPAKRFERALPSERLARAFAPDDRGFESVGRVLLLGSADPPAAVGPRSFHHQLLERMGAATAITDGAPWQELDAESVIRLAPDAIILFAPGRTEADAAEALGLIATLETPAKRHNRFGVITHPYALIPSTSLAAVADEVRSLLEQWREAPSNALDSAP
ncbi:MAG: hypothetical protein CMJ31_08100 [Phycisphaerae bacterium]|nr:hypothetical protein [Phycisphaerae bacterium]